MLTVSCKSVPVAFSLFDSNPLSPSVGGAEFVGAMVVTFFFFALGGAVFEGHLLSLQFFLTASPQYQESPAQIKSVVHFTLNISSAKLLC